MFLGKVLYSHSASLHPGIQVCTGEYNDASYPDMDKHFLQEGAGGGGGTLGLFMQWKPKKSCKPDGPLGLNADLTLPYSRMTLRCKVEVLYNL